MKFIMSVLGVPLRLKLAAPDANLLDTGNFLLTNSIYEPVFFFLFLYLRYNVEDLIQIDTLLV